MKKWIMSACALMLSVAVFGHSETATMQPENGEQSLVSVTIIMQADHDNYFRPYVQNQTTITYNNGTGSVRESLPWGVTTINVVPNTEILVGFIVYNAGEPEHFMSLYTSGFQKHTTPCDNDLIYNSYWITASANHVATATFTLVPFSEADRICFQ